jgi:hypothetical protein
MWSIGYLAVPILFQSLPDKMLAGMLAGKMFTFIAYIGMTSASYLLLHQLISLGKAAFRQTIFRLVLCMLLLTIAGLFGIQPLMVELKAQALPADVMHSAFANRFKMLHGISSIVYLVQSILGAVLVLKIKSGLFFKEQHK